MRKWRQDGWQPSQGHIESKSMSETRWSPSSLTSKLWKRVIGPGIIRVDFPDEVGFTLVWEDLQGLLSHASFLNKHGEAGIPIIPRDEKGSSRNAESCGGDMYKKVGGGREEKFVEL